eukprot:CFRG5019T1
MGLIPTVRGSLSSKSPASVASARKPTPSFTPIHPSTPTSTLSEQPHNADESSNTTSASLHTPTLTSISTAMQTHLHADTGTPANTGTHVFEHEHADISVSRLASKSESNLATISEDVFPGTASSPTDICEGETAFVGTPESAYECRGDNEACGSGNELIRDCGKENPTCGHAYDSASVSRASTRAQATTGERTPSPSPTPADRFIDSIHFANDGNTHVGMKMNAAGTTTTPKLTPATPPTSMGASLMPTPPLSSTSIIHVAETMSVTIDMKTHENLSVTSSPTTASLIDSANTTFLNEEAQSSPKSGTPTPTFSTQKTNITNIVTTKNNIRGRNLETGTLYTETTKSLENVSGNIHESLDMDVGSGICVGGAAAPGSSTNTTLVRKRRKRKGSARKSSSKLRADTDVVANIGTITPHREDTPAPMPCPIRAKLLMDDKDAEIDVTRMYVELNMGVVVNEEGIHEKKLTNENDSTVNNGVVEATTETLMSVGLQKDVSLQKDASSQEEVGYVKVSPPTSKKHNRTRTRKAISTRTRPKHTDMNAEHAAVNVCTGMDDNVPPEVLDIVSLPTIANEKIAVVKEKRAARTRKAHRTSTTSISEDKMSIDMDTSVDVDEVLVEEHIEENTLSRTERDEVPRRISKRSRTVKDEPLPTPKKRSKSIKPGNASASTLLPAENGKSKARGKRKTGRGKTKSGSEIAHMPFVWRMRVPVDPKQCAFPGCPYVSRKPNDLSHLTSHLDVHALGSEKLLCPYADCNDEFEQARALNVHLRITVHDGLEEMPPPQSDIEDENAAIEGTKDTELSLVVQGGPSATEYDSEGYGYETDHKDLNDDVGWGGSSGEETRRVRTTYDSDYDNADENDNEPDVENTPYAEDTIPEDAKRHDTGYEVDGDKVVSAKSMQSKANRSLLKKKIVNSIGTRTKPSTRNTPKLGLDVPHENDKTPGNTHGHMTAVSANSSPLIADGSDSDFDIGSAVKIRKENRQTGRQSRRTPKKARRKSGGVSDDEDSNFSEELISTSDDSGSDFNANSVTATRGKRVRQSSQPTVQSTSTALVVIVDPNKPPSVKKPSPPLQCPYPGCKHMTTESALCAHLNTHSIFEKNVGKAGLYFCPFENECDKRFKQVNGLAYHLKRQVKVVNDVQVHIPPPPRANATKPNIRRPAVPSAIRYDAVQSDGYSLGRESSKLISPMQHSHDMGSSRMSIKQRDLLFRSDPLDSDPRWFIEEEVFREFQPTSIRTTVVFNNSPYRLSSYLGHSYDPSTSFTLKLVKPQARQHIRAHTNVDVQAKTTNVNDIHRDSTRTVVLRPTDANVGVAYDLSEHIQRRSPENAEVSMFAQPKQTDFAMYFPSGVVGMAWAPNHDRMAGLERQYLALAVEDDYIYASTLPPDKYAASTPSHVYAGGHSGHQAAAPPPEEEPAAPPPENHGMAAPPPGFSTPALGRLDPSTSTPSRVATLQLWDCGVLRSEYRSGEEEDYIQPRRAMVVALKGTTTVKKLTWCPAHAREKPKHAQPRTHVQHILTPKRLGLLAVTGVDGVVRIYAMPYPKHVQQQSEYKDESSAALVHLDPACVLVPPRPLTRCTSLDWGISHRIVVGTIDGLAVLYDLAPWMNALPHPNPRRTIDLRHVHMWVASRRPVNVVCWHPHFEQTVVMTSSINGEWYMWDIRNTTTCLFARNTYDYPAAVVWPNSTGSYISATAYGLIRLHDVIEHKIEPFWVQRVRPGIYTNMLSYSLSLNAIGAAFDDGSVSVYNIGNIRKKKVPKDRHLWLQVTVLEPNPIPQILPSLVQLKAERAAEATDTKGREREHTVLRPDVGPTSTHVPVHPAVYTQSNPNKHVWMINDQTGELGGQDKKKMPPPPDCIEEFIGPKSGSAKFMSFCPSMQSGAWTAVAYGSGFVRLRWCGDI